MGESAGEKVTRIRALRDRRGVSQQALADAVGSSLSTIRRLESGQLGADAPLWLLVNVAFALGADVVEDILEPDWLKWQTSEVAPRPPQREFFWRAPPKPDEHLTPLEQLERLRFGT